MSLLDLSELTEAVGGEYNEFDEEEVIHRFRSDSALEVPVRLTDADIWSNFTNEKLYLWDRAVRNYFNKTRYMRYRDNGMQTTVPLVFAFITGRNPTPDDSDACRILHKLLRYYCTKYTGQTTYGGKKVTHVYMFSKFSVNHKRAYSLRLRLEEMDGGDPFRRGASKDKRYHGRRPNRTNIALPDGSGCQLV